MNIINNINYLSRQTEIHQSAIIESPIRTYGFIQIKKDSEVGRFSYFNHNSTVFRGVKIGRYCSIGKNCQIGVYEHPLDWITTSPITYNMGLHFPDYYGQFKNLKIKRSGPAFIGNDVWMGSNVIVKRGVTIGDGAVIAGGAMVTKDVPPYAIFGGMPAKLIRYRFDHETILSLIKSKWWDLPVDKLKNIDFSNIEKALVELNKINEEVMTKKPDKIAVKKTDKAK